MWALSRAVHLVKYLWQAKRPHQMHSPYLYDLLTFMHDAQRHYYAFDHIEAQRHVLLRNNATVPGEDYGAGSHKLSTGSRPVRDIARTSLSSPTRCRMMFRLIVYTRPACILEMGTSLGIMTAYLAKVSDKATVHTLEGHAGRMNIAQDVARELRLHNIIFHQGRFSETLPHILHSGRPIQLALIDGDHRGASLIAYFGQILPCLSDDAVVVVDDIRWSAGMYAAWRSLTQDPAVTCSLDYFSFGMLFIRHAFRGKMHMQILP